MPGDACTAGAASTAHGSDRISRNSYDALGRVTKVESAVGTAEAIDEVRRAYTANGQVDHVIDGESNRTTYVYDGFDRLSQTRYPATTKGADSSNASDYEGLSYDARSSVTQRRLRDGTTIGYSYDDLGRLAAKDLPGSARYDLHYDLLGRALSVVRGGHTNSFAHDALGRATRASVPSARAAFRDRQVACCRFGGHQGWGQALQAYRRGRSASRRDAQGTARLARQLSPS